MMVIFLGIVLVNQPKIAGAVTVDMFPPKVLTKEEYMQKIFGDKTKIATAVILHESGNSLSAINYNCIYGGKSTFCKPQDRAQAWSVDCGIGQINVKGKVCPKELLTLEGNMKAIEQKYKTQGLNAWVSYSTGRYKMYL